MSEDRLFWPQGLMDEWIDADKASIDDDVLEIADENMKYRLHQAIHFISDVGDGSDAHGLVGRVKETEEIEKMGGEHYMDSAIIGDSAYEVVQGFTGLPLTPLKKAVANKDDDNKPSGAKPEEAQTADRELLANFLLDNL